MPKSSRLNDYYGCSIITGPSHCFVRLRFGKRSDEPVVMEKLPPVGDCDHGALDEGEIEKAVKHGVARANSDFETSYAVSGIQYVENDSRRYEMHARASYLIVKMLEKKPEAFERTGK